MPRGKYIVIEGGDGVGKGTQVELLLQRLKSSGIKAKYIREPGGDRDGEKIRYLVLDPDNRLMPRAKVMLFNAARIQTLRLIKQYLDRETWCIADRSFVSTLAYQCFGEGLPLDETDMICQFATSQLQPDCVLVLHAPFEVVSQRRSDRGTSDWFEEQGEDFHRRVIEGYRVLAHQRDIPLVDATGTPEAVGFSIWAHIEPLTSMKG